MCEEGATQLSFGHILVPDRVVIYGDICHYTCMSFVLVRNFLELRPVIRFAVAAPAIPDAQMETGHWEKSCCFHNEFQECVMRDLYCLCAGGAKINAITEINLFCQSSSIIGLICKYFLESWRLLKNKISNNRADGRFQARKCE